MKLYLFNSRHANRDIITYYPSSYFLETIIQETLIPYSRIDDFDIVEAAKNGYHIIAVGIIGLTCFSLVCEHAFNINQFQQEKLITLVNEKKETGTLFPIYRLTILPFRYRTSAVITLWPHDYTQGKGFSESEIKMHLRDALKAEVEYIKSNKVVFAFVDLMEEAYLYTKILLGLLSGEYKYYNGECYIFYD